MKTLFIGIFDSKEPNTALRNAIREVSSDYREIGWVQIHRPQNRQIAVRTLLRTFNPDLVILQLQAPNVLTPETITALRNTGAFIVQWTGDVRQPLPKHYIEVGKRINLSLFTNQNDVDEMRRHGCKAEYLQCAADHNIYTPTGSVTMAPKIVFMGNHYKSYFELSNYRHDMVRFLKSTYGPAFGVYGSGWGNDLSPHNLMFKQEQEAEIYRSCLIAINCSHINLKRYTSDRFFRILLSGAFCLSKEFPDMEEYTKNDEQKQRFAYFKQDCNFTELKEAIDYYLKYDDIRKMIAKNGQEYAYNNWTWPRRITELLKLIG